MWMNLIFVPMNVRNQHVMQDLCVWVFNISCWNGRLALANACACVNSSKISITLNIVRIKQVKSTYLIMLFKLKRIGGY